MKYKLINTSNIPSDDIHTAIRFVAPKGINNFTITVKPTELHIWDAYSYPSKKVPSAKFFFQSDDIKFPQVTNTRLAKSAGYFPICVLKNKYELLICLFAHELRHIWQRQISTKDFDKSKIGKYLGFDGKEYKVYMTNFQMERDACKYAKKMLYKYRKI